MSEIATEAEMATVFDQTDMPTWPLDNIFLPSNIEWATLANPNLVTLRIAGVTVGKTKPELLELVESFSDMPGDGAERTALMDIVDQMIATRAMLDNWVTLLSTAETRLMMAFAKLIEAAEDRQEAAQPC